MSRQGWIRISEQFKLGNHRYVICRCDCGVTKRVRLKPDGSLRSKSCLQCFRFFAKKKKAKHGHCRGDTVTPTYRAWTRMKYRAGPSLEPRWHRFATFLEDIGERPTRTAALRRADASEGWTFGNVHWVEV
jgi:hypothetical protein